MSDLLDIVGYWGMEGGCDRPFLRWGKWGDRTLSQELTDSIRKRDL
jgi:hypothetical protein